jgi:formate dehydrogenase subunit delta
MAGTELQHLIKMMNQISDNMALTENDELAAARVADHIKRFWARSMKEKIISYASSDGEMLQGVSMAAIRLLQPRP